MVNHQAQCRWLHECLSCETVQTLDSHNTDGLFLGSLVWIESPGSCTNLDAANQREYWSGRYLWLPCLPVLGEKWHATQQTSHWLRKSCEQCLLCRDKKSSVVYQLDFGSKGDMKCVRTDWTEPVYSHLVLSRFDIMMPGGNVVINWQKLSRHAITTLCFSFSCLDTALSFL